MKLSRRIGTLLALALLAGGGGAALAPVHVAQAPLSLAAGPSVAHAEQTNGTDQKATVAPAKPSTDNGSWWDGSTFNDLLAFLFAKIASLFAWLLAVAALLLDGAVWYTIVKMKDFVTGVSNIGVAWRVLRDIGNIALIFGFLLAGISVIIDTGFYGFNSKMLPKLLVAAVLLNFSLLISEVIIDTGNLFAVEIYTQINGGALPSPCQFAGGSKSSGCPTDSSVGTAITNEGISNSIMKVLGLQQIYNKAEKGTTAQGAQTFVSKSILANFLACILFLVAAFVFFSLAFIVIARFVALLFVIILAPLGFAGLIIPKLNNIAQKWWSTLAEQTITAPVLMLLLYVALAIITGTGFISSLLNGTSNTSSTAAWEGLFNANTSANLMSGISIVLVFAIAMALLLAVVVVSKQMSAFGGQWATRMGGRLSFGAVSLGGRLTVGGLGVMGASKRMQALSTPRKGDSKVTRAARLLALRPLVFTSKGLRAGAYDIRNTGAGSLLKSYGIDAGSGAKMTAQQLQDARRKYQPGMLGLKEGAFWKESRAEYEAAAREADTRKALKEAQDLAPTNPTGADDIAQRTLGKMTTKELEDLDAIKAGVEVLVRNLSPEQFENLMKSDKITEGQKEKMKEGRYKPLEDAIRRNDARAVGQWSTKDLAIVAPQMLRDPALADGFASFMSASQYDSVFKNDRLTRNEQQLLKTTRDAALVRRLTDTSPYIDPTTGVGVISPITGAPMTGAEFALSSISSTNRGKLSGNVFTVPAAPGAPPGGPLSAREDVLDLLDAADFRAISRNEDLTRPQREAIGGYIQNVISGTRPSAPARQAQVTALARTPAIKSYFNLP